MRPALLALALALVGPTLVSGAALAEAPAAEASAEVPLPEGAVPRPSMTKGTDGRIVVYDVPRAPKAVLDEVKAALAKGKWDVTTEPATGTGTATRLQAKKGGRLWKLSVSGDKDKTVLIVTRPA